MSASWLKDLTIEEWRDLVAMALGSARDTNRRPRDTNRRPRDTSGRWTGSPLGAFHGNGDTGKRGGDIRVTLALSRGGPRPG